MVRAFARGAMGRQIDQHVADEIMLVTPFYVTIILLHVKVKVTKVVSSCIHYISIMAGIHEAVCWVLYPV